MSKFDTLNIENVKFILTDNGNEKITENDFDSVKEELEYIKNNRLDDYYIQVTVYVRKVDGRIVTDETYHHNKKF